MLDSIFGKKPLSFGDLRMVRGDIGHAAKIQMIL